MSDRRDGRYDTLTLIILVSGRMINVSYICSVSSCFSYGSTLLIPSVDFVDTSLLFREAGESISFAVLPRRKTIQNNNISGCMVNPDRVSPRKNSK